MEFEPTKLQLTDDNGNDLLADVSIGNMMQEVTAKMIQDINVKREAIIREKLKEIVGLDIDIEQEQKRRFKRLSIEYRDNEETIYFNDGSIKGKRIVTFVKKDAPFDYINNDFKMSTEYSYY